MIVYILPPPPPPTPPPPPPPRGAPRPPPPPRGGAQAAGVNVATLYYHCGNKDQLFTAIYERVVDSMAAFVGESFASGDRFPVIVAGIVDRVVAFFARPPSLP